MQKRNTLLKKSSSLRLHDLIKAPENSESSIAARATMNPRQPVTVYRSPERLPNGHFTEALTIVLHTKGCHWWWSSGCTFCGYYNDTRDDIGADELEAQWAAAFDEVDMSEIGMLKVFTCGSLFEDREIPPSFQDKVLKTASENDLHLIVESRTEQLTDEKIFHATSIHSDLCVAIGLEAHDDEVLQFHINKGFTVKSWKDAAVRLRTAGVRVKTYLMFKPPFMSEYDSLSHCIKWVGQVSQYSDEISVNPMNIQRGTIIDRIHRSKSYRPPWLWSLVRLIKESHPKLNHSGNFSSRLIVHPTAAGKTRGAHNCGSCDFQVASAIETYSIDGCLDIFEELDCNCRQRWMEELAIESSLPIPLGFSLTRRGGFRYRNPLT